MRIGSVSLLISVLLFSLGCEEPNSSDSFPKDRIRSSCTPPVEELEELSTISVQTKVDTGLIETGFNVREELSVDAQLTAFGHKIDQKRFPIPVCGHDLPCRTPFPLNGCNHQSEAAVERALEWIAGHQCADGGWSFDSRKTPCDGKCANRRTHNGERVGATALALLPLLASGYTHKKGDYKTVVEKGLTFIVATLEREGHSDDADHGSGIDISHGLVTLALCNAYGRTRDQRLFIPASKALNRLVAAQDADSGGWRGFERYPDFPASMLLLTACHAGHTCFLSFSPLDHRGVVRYLDALQADDGVRYGNPASEELPTWTAAGILARIRMGWKRDHPTLKKAIAYLEKEASDHRSDLLFNLVAANVLFHYGGEPWKRFNPRVRDRLTETQSREGHEAGSWYVGNEFPYALQGGRLYATTLATLTLEVYYRETRLIRNEPAKGFVIQKD